MRHDIRLRTFDYASAATYFVTFTLAERIPLFGSVTDQGFASNDIGDMVQSEIEALEQTLSGVLLGSFVVMPDHVHLIVSLQTVPDASGDVTLGQVVGRVKSRTTVMYGQGVREHGWPPYKSHLWLPNYFERIVRNDRELLAIRSYMERNPYALLDRWLALRDGPDGRG